MKSKAMQLTPAFNFQVSAFNSSDLGERIC